MDEHSEGSARRFAITPPDHEVRILGGAHLIARGGRVPRDVGYWIRGSMTRQGIAAAAVSALLVLAFDRWGLDRVTAHCDVANSVSAAFLGALGFATVGAGTRAYPDGTPRPVLRFELTKADYQQDHATALRERATGVRVILK